MKRLSSELIARWLQVVNFLLLINIITAWVFVQFVHYHAQNTPLSPDDFTFDLATKEDYAKLSDPAVRDFTYADGRYMVKAKGWGDLNMASYYAPSTDGRFYVQVMLKGTAPFARTWTDNMILVLLFAIPALVLSMWNYRNVVRSSHPTVVPNEVGEPANTP